jgi:hypothetical protein
MNAPRITLLVLEMKIAFTQVGKEYRSTLPYVKIGPAEPLEAVPAPEE